MRREHRTRPGGDLDSGVDGGRRQRELAVADLAARQRGVVTRAQLLEAGLTPHAIDHRLRSGRLHALHRGVYLVGHAVPAEGARELAALLACGPGAVLSHRSAASLWRLLPVSTDELEVTVAGRDPGRKPGIRVHCVTALDRRDVRKLRGIPITTPARTILDLAAVVTPRELEQALAEAQTRRLARRSELVALLARVGRRPGVATLRSLLEADKAPALIRSDAEKRFLGLIRRAELPTPDVNVRICGYEVDFLWRQQGLVVEVDGFRFHSSRAAFERDRLRDARLGAAGLRVLRVTWRQIVDRPEALVSADRDRPSNVAVRLSSGGRGGGARGCNEAIPSAQRSSTRRRRCAPPRAGPAPRSRRRTCRSRPAQPTAGWRSRAPRRSTVTCSTDATSASILAASTAAAWSGPTTGRRRR